MNQSSAVAPPIYQTATFRSDSAKEFTERTARRASRVYTRFGNPTLAQAERVLADLENAEAALVTSSGMAASTAAVFAFVQSGDHIVAQANHYGGRRRFCATGCRNSASRRRTSINATRLHSRAMRPETKLVLVESPSNPVMHLTDLQAVAELQSRAAQ